MKGWTLKLVEEPGVKRSIRQYQAEGYTWNGATSAALLDEVQDQLERIERATGSTADRDYLASIVSKLRAVR